MKKILKVISVGLTIALGMSMVGCAKKDENKSSLNSIKKNGVLKIGVFSDKPPFGYIDEDGKNQGFDVYIAKRFAKDLLGDESKLELVLVEAASRVEYLQSGKVDIILANFTVTDERKEKVDFANPYMKVSLGVVSSNDSLITDVSQLEGQKLIVNKGTTAETFFTENYPNIELLKYDQNTEAFQALKDGRGAALAHDNTLLFAWAKENNTFTTGIETLGSLDYIAPAVSKGNESLLKWVNDELISIGKENFIHEAYNTTLEPIYGSTIDVESVVVESAPVQ